MNETEYQTLYELEDSYWWYKALHRLVMRLVNDVVASGQVPQLLDAGCGTGGFLAKLQKENRSVRGFGIDLSETALELAGQRKLQKLVEGSVGRLPYANETFDLVVSLDVLYHSKVASDEAAIKEFSRVLKPGGTLVLHLPAFEMLRGSHDEAVHGARRYGKENLKVLVERNGFSLQALRYRLAFLFFPLLLRRLFSRDSLRNESGNNSSSDLTRLPAAIDKALYFAAMLEDKIPSCLTLPFGTSLLCVAKKL